MSQQKLTHCTWRDDDGNPHGKETRLFISVPEVEREFGTCAGHAQEMLNATKRLFGSATLLAFTSRLVERWGAVPVSIEGAVLADSEPFKVET
jgi:hypothetical protein